MLYTFVVLTVRFKREHPKRKLASFSMFFQPFVFSGARLRIFRGAVNSCTELGSKLRHVCWSGEFDN